MTRRVQAAGKKKMKGEKKKRKRRRSTKERKKESNIAPSPTTLYSIATCYSCAVCVWREMVSAYEEASNVCMDVKPFVRSFRM